VFETTFPRGPARSRSLSDTLATRANSAQGRLLFCGILLFATALLIRVINLRQPLVENYIDRQVHTAMMAQHIARGGSLLRPEIDIGPFPSYYMLEFPGYPMIAAALASLTELPLDTAGRLASAFAMGMACVLFFDLVRRHDGLFGGLAAGAVLALMPVTIRYGRAFQPDSVMFLLLITSVWAMDRWRERGSAGWLAIATIATSGALLLKVIAGYVLLPLAYLAWCRYRTAVWKRPELYLAAALVLLPSAWWYVHAWHVASTSTSVSTQFWQAHKWFGPGRFLEFASYRQLAYFIGIRVLTPIGTVLAILGALFRPGRTHCPQHQHSVRANSCEAAVESSYLFHVWLVSLLAYVPILMRKVDHEHYYMAIAPIAAVFIARALIVLSAIPSNARLLLSGRQMAVALAAGLVFTDVLAVRSTYRDPREWQFVTEAAAAVRELTPPQALIISPSSVLFYADRRGFAMDYAPADVAYLFSTFGVMSESVAPTELVEFYRSQGATHFIELLGRREHREVLDTLRSRFRLLREEPGKFIVFALDD